MKADVMRAEEIQSRLHTRWLAHSCICLESVDSTNHYAKKVAEEGALHGTLVTAEEQTLGKGRWGRSWESEKNVNIIMSLILRPAIRPEHASQTTLLMAMAVVRGIREVTGLKAEIKWPNDVVVHGKKVCGILTEMNTEVEAINYVIIGIGINTNQEHFPKELAYAGSLRAELGRAISRAELTAGIMDAFEEVYEIFLLTEDLSKLYQRYNQICVNRGKQIRVQESGHEYTGTTAGINEKGELVVLKEDGEAVCVYAGEASVRGLYGYV